MYDSSPEATSGDSTPNDTHTYIYYYRNRSIFNNFCRFFMYLVHKIFTYVYKIIFILNCIYAEYFLYFY